MWNLLVFALIGLGTGALARMFYPGRQPEPILGTFALGMIGAVVAGLLFWNYSPVEGEIPIVNYLLSLLGAGLFVVLWSGWAYARRWSEFWSSSR